jgi:hypothetical protein
MISVSYDILGLGFFGLGKRWGSKNRKFGKSDDTSGIAAPARAQGGWHVAHVSAKKKPGHS